MPRGSFSSWRTTPSYDSARSRQGESLTENSTATTSGCLASTSRARRKAPMSDPVAPMPAFTKSNVHFGKARRQPATNFEPHWFSRFDAPAPCVIEPPITAMRMDSPRSSRANTCSKRDQSPATSRARGPVSSSAGTFAPLLNDAGSSPTHGFVAPGADPTSNPRIRQPPSFIDIIRILLRTQRPPQMPTPPMQTPADASRAEPPYGPAVRTPPRPAAASASCHAAPMGAGPSPSPMPPQPPEWRSRQQICIGGTCANYTIPNNGRQFLLLHSHTLGTFCYTLVHG